MAGATTTTTVLMTGLVGSTGLRRHAALADGGSPGLVAQDAQVGGGPGRSAGE